MIKNLNQLKKAMKGNPRFQIIAHCRKECIGEIRQVTQTNTTGFYSSVTGNPEDLHGQPRPWLDPLVEQGALLEFPGRRLQCL